MLKNDKKGQMGVAGIPDLVWTVIIIGIFIVIGLVVMTKIRDTADAGSQAWLAGNETIAAVAEIPGWLTTIITLAIAGIIITLVYFFKQRGS